MKNLTMILVVVLLLVSGQADALGLRADLAYFSAVDSPYHSGELTGVGGGVTLLDLGVAELLLEGRLVGDPTHLKQLVSLYLKRAADDELQSGAFLMGDAAFNVNTEWPLTPDLRIAAKAGIGDIAYFGGLAGEKANYSLYRGVRVGAGLRRKIAPTASLIASVEFGPHLVQVFGRPESFSASWTAVELGVQFNIPLGFVKGGLRVNSLREPRDSQRFSGVFLSGGLGF